MTTRRNELKELQTALHVVQATPFEYTAAHILLAVNGLENALAYARSCPDHRPPPDTPGPDQDLT